MTDSAPTHDSSSTPDWIPPRSAADLPPGVDLLWGLRERPRRGPKPGLTLDQIVAAGIKIADAEGLAPLSMSRLADELGFTTMSLYRYVGSKEELLALMFDAASREVFETDQLQGDWRTGLEQWCRASFAFFYGHPWSLHIALGAHLIGPSSVAWMESAMRSLAGTNLTGGQKFGTVMLLNGFVRSEARAATDVATSAKPTPDGTPVSYSQMMRTLVNPRRFPELAAVLQSRALDGDDGYSNGFEFGLVRVLDGISALIDAQGPRAAVFAKGAPEDPFSK